VSKLNYITAAILAATVSPTLSAQVNLEPVTVTATKIATTDVAATYASEVYDATDIASSGADTLYAFLNQNTSITIMPSYGNKFSQLIDMRGYGLGDGFQNIVISLNGRRLNNIDTTPQLLSAISLSDIERIEITKGSGSVIYGDGATAGSIQIYTKDTVSHNVSLRLGNYGQKSASFSTGLSEQFFKLSVSGDHSELDGFSDKDINGFKDDSSNNNSRVLLEVLPTDKLKLTLGKEHSTIDTRYSGHMTLAEYNADPSQNSGNSYNNQKFDTDTILFGISANITENLEVAINHSNEDKKSTYVGSSPYLYDYKNDELIVKYHNQQFNLTSGIQRFDGSRSQTGNITTKENIGYFAQANYFVGDMTFSLGGRRESVDYRYSPTSGSSATEDYDVSSYDLGFNKRINEQVSVFANYNSAFQAPDIDRFFTYPFPTYIATFNNFLPPTKSKTINIGLNHVTTNSKSKLTLFRANLNNEIFFDPLSFSNTNIDKSHKYGLELQNRFQLTDKIASSFNYAYTRAIIDNDDAGSGSFDGKNLPGVSRHNVTVALHYLATDHSNIVLSHNYRSSAYALNDFANSFSQKQQPYQATNLAYSYTHDQLVVTVSVDNVFDKSNGIWVRNDAIYPVNFTRSWSIGAKYNF